MPNQGLKPRFFYIRKVLLNNDFYKTNNRENVTKTNKKQVSNILENPNPCFSGFETAKNFVFKSLKHTWTLSESITEHKYHLKDFRKQMCFVMRFIACKHQLHQVFSLKCC